MKARNPQGGVTLFINEDIGLKRKNPAGQFCAGNKVTGHSTHPFQVSVDHLI